ncbi:type VI secretion system tube protein TssD [Aquimarina algicola]|uniref:Uncharacterized protein n=1 Tax=Aquimarina algicola TaxID=2589995 RepID=A0A504IZ98_9FLAO|nr:type VI secretion system tube protein TssD [Aquimarina algicola]TPN83856.1 hypothetical protein FHK87_17980 [Aquimarina algicola]
MSIQTKFYIHDKVYNVLEYEFSIDQNIDYSNRPCAKPLFAGLEMVIEASKDNVFFEEALKSYNLLQCKLVRTLVAMNGKSHTLYLIDAIVIKFTTIYKADGTTPVAEKIQITAAGLKDSNSPEEYSAGWRVTPLLTEQVAEEQEEETRAPRIVDGYWAYDEAGQDVYRYYEEKENRLHLGDTMYFCVKTRDIDAGSQIKLQLFDYDQIFWSDYLDRDTDKFPNDPVIKTVTVEDTGMAILKIELQHSWEPVIKQEDKVTLGVEDIELYCKATYNGTVTELANTDKYRLKVTYSNQDLFIKPAVEGVKMPEMYTSEGKLVLFALGAAKDIAEAYGITGKVSHFLATKIKITTKTMMISEVNMIKKHIYTERIDLRTNISKGFGYEVTEASNYVIKDSFSYIDIEERIEHTKKAFSDYFNPLDIANGAVAVFNKVNDVLKFLDYLEMPKKVLDLLPDEGMSLNIPNPSTVYSISSTALSTSAKVIPGLSSALTGFGALLFATDIIANKVASEILGDTKEFIQVALEKAKQNGLSSVRTFMQTDGAKISNYSLETDISHENHCAVMNGKIKTLSELIDARNDKGNVFYTYIIKTHTVKGEQRFLIDSIIKQ